MLLVLRNDHKEHLNLLTTQSTQVLVDFCKLTIDYLQNGPNAKVYGTAAKKLGVEAEVIQNTVYGLANLLLESCKHNLSEADFRDSVLTLGFTQDQQTILNKFYKQKKAEITETLSQITVTTPHYYDLDWRFEVQLASRTLLHQVTPLVRLNFCLEMQPDNRPKDYEGRKENIVLQTDPTNLLHIAEVLENALLESRSQHSRRIQRALMKN